MTYTNIFRQFWYMYVVYYEVNSAFVCFKLDFCDDAVLMQFTPDKVSHDSLRTTCGMDRRLVLLLFKYRIALIFITVHILHQTRFIIIIRPDCV